VCALPRDALTYGQRAPEHGPLLGRLQCGPRPGPAILRDGQPKMPPQRVLIVFAPEQSSRLQQRNDLLAKPSQHTRVL